MLDKRLFLLDGHALVYRAHFAFINRPLINSKGVNTSAVTGFTRTLWDLMRSQNPTHLAVVFDPEGPTFRNDMYAEYKANREEQPEDIAIAIPYVTKIVDAFRIPIVVVPNYEADDVIGTLAKQAEAKGYKVYMVTPDKDFGQLVTENVVLYKPSRQGSGVEIMGVKEICMKWGIDRTEQVIDMLALQGDSIDNIPGIPGIGPKTAAKLLAKYHTLEGLLEHTHELKGKQKENVETYRDQGLLSKELATIKVDVPIQFDAKRYEIEPFDRDRLSKLFKELEFRTLAQHILGEHDDKHGNGGHGQQGQLFDNNDSNSSNGATPEYSVAENDISNTEHHYQMVDTPEKRKDLIQKLRRQKAFCFDTETTHVEPVRARMVGMAFAFQPGEAFYVPVPAKDFEAAKQIVQEFSDLFADEQIEKVAQNIKYDMIVLRHYGVTVKGAFFDTMIAHYLLEPELRHNMDYLAETYLKYKPISIEELIGKKGKKQGNMADLPPQEITEYAAEDADITLQLAAYLRPWLEKENMVGLYQHLEEPLVRVLADMEYEGVNIDVPFLGAYADELTGKINELEKEIHEMAGTAFNIASPRQVGEVLFDRMEIPYKGRKTKTGQYSTNEEKLSDLAAAFPIAGKILDHRGLTKLKSTYVEALPKLVNPDTGRIHSNFNQALTATGRLSSNNPNLQNIPVRTPEGARIRKAFIPRNENYTLLAADYSQIELRLIAEISGDEAMLEAFQSGQDIHRATAARVFGVPFEGVTREQRYRAKTVNFAIIYGAGATNLSQQLEISRTEARELIDQYFDQYAGLKKYMEDTVDFARKNGYVSTIKGRRRQLRDIHSKSSLERGNAERMAINTPIQGTAADLIKLAMINIYRELQRQQFQTKMILQVHDELIFDVPKEELDKVRPIIVEKMRDAIPELKVPIVVEAGVGDNWLEAH